MFGFGALKEIHETLTEATGSENLAFALIIVGLILVVGLLVLCAWAIR